ncbi:Ldh family oxidoreductase, partial [Paraburkholderia sp.]|uniref:Ldh family oxidoreductase n=1 Tax=Paraburkholderia sp. TaxID=1926495 RepID=UPI003C7C7CF6
MARLSPDALTALAIDTLRRAGALEATAESTARALVYADLRGLSSHGVARLPMYCAQLRNGRVDPVAQPAIVADRGAAVLVDGADGLAYPACDLAVSTLIDRARQFGSAVAGVKRSHHFGVGAAHLAALGAAGLVALAF